MNILIKQIELIQRIDSLVRIKATGSGPELATKLGISKTKLYRMLNVMKDLNAPMEYDESIKSFVYIEEVGLVFGFYPSTANGTNVQSLAW